MCVKVIFIVYENFRVAQGPEYVKKLYVDMKTLPLYSRPFEFFSYGLCDRMGIA